MKQLIINADDFGINEAVTSEIERMIELQAITSTTVMANGKCLDEVRHFAPFHPEVSFGVHLCLSEYTSLTRSDALCQAGITDDEGKFIHKAIFDIKSFTDDGKRAIEDELNAQIDVVSSLGFPLSHADSHHHVHTIYSLRQLFAEVLQKRGIEKVRLGTGFYGWRSRRHLVLWLQRVKLNKFYKKHFATTDAFCSYASYVKSGVQYNNAIVELMCHPGHSGKTFVDEMGLVASKKALSGDIKLISYNDLH